MDVDLKESTSNDNTSTFNKHQCFS